MCEFVQVDLKVSHRKLVAEESGYSSHLLHQVKIKLGKPLKTALKKHNFTPQETNLSEGTETALSFFRAFFARVFFLFGPWLGARLHPSKPVSCKKAGIAGEVTLSAKNIGVEDFFAFVFVHLAFSFCRIRTNAPLPARVFGPRPKT